MSLSMFVKAFWFPKFIPKYSKKYTIHAWRVAAICGPNEIILKNLHTGKAENILLSDMKNNFFSPEMYIKYAKREDFNLVKINKHSITFVKNPDLD